MSAMSHIGVNLGFGNLHEKLTDEQMYAGELALAELADRLGYDSLWAVEHHFDDYAMCPDNVVLLANVAGRTRRLRLGTAAVILKPAPSWSARSSAATCTRSRTQTGTPLSSAATSPSPPPSATPKRLRTPPVSSDECGTGLAIRAGQESPGASGKGCRSPGMRPPAGPVRPGASSRAHASHQHHLTRRRGTAVAHLTEMAFGPIPPRVTDHPKTDFP
jgi:Luciferase-like monooxygenase